MGCADSRLRGNSSEIAITYAEKGLNICCLDVIAMDEKLRKYSDRGHINQNQLEHLSKKCDFKIKNYENHSKLEDLFTIFRTQGDGDYELKIMLILFILLARGDTKTKAKLLFEVFDPSFSRVISVPALKEMFESLCYVSLTVGKLVVATQTPHSHSSRNDDYLYNLTKAKPAACDSFIKEVMKDNSSQQIDRKHFIKNMIKLEGGGFITALGVRAFLKKFESTGHIKYNNPFLKKTAEQTYTSEL